MSLCTAYRRATWCAAASTGGDDTDRKSGRFTGFEALFACYVQYGPMGRLNSDGCVHGSGVRPRWSEASHDGSSMLPTPSRLTIRPSAVTVVVAGVPVRTA